MLLWLTGIEGGRGLAIERTQTGPAPDHDSGNFGQKEEPVRVIPATDQFHSLGQMQSCQAFIIANSTCSWWAAWLSHSPDVICPDRFLPGQDWEIYPARWSALPGRRKFFSVKSSKVFC